METEYETGLSASFSKTIAECDIYNFAGITGDFNPLHLNAEAAGKTVFGNRIAHGMLVASFISTVIATYLPGPGTVYMEQNTRFIKPVYIGDTVTATVEIQELLEKRRARLRTRVMNQNKIIVADGTALVKLPDKRGL